MRANATCSDGASGAYLSAGNEGKLFHYTAGQMKPLAQVKGGIVFAIERTLGVPVRFVGVGEKVGDLVRFEPADFVSALFG